MLCPIYFVTLNRSWATSLSHFPPTPNMRKEIVNQIEEAQRVPGRNTLRHIIFKLTKIKEKENIKATRKKQITYKGAPIRLSSDFSTETLKPEGDNLFKVTKYLSAMISSDIFSGLFSLSSPSYEYMVHLMLSERFLRLSSFFHYFFLYSILWQWFPPFYHLGHLSILLPQLFCYWFLLEYCSFLFVL